MEKESSCCGKSGACGGCKSGGGEGYTLMDEVFVGGHSVRAYLSLSDFSVSAEIDAGDCERVANAMGIPSEQVAQSALRETMRKTEKKLYDEE